jgi:hypothetical protein
MKKSRALRVFILAGSTAALIPQGVVAVAVNAPVAGGSSCSTVSSASDVAECNIAATGYLAEDLSFSGSKGVSMSYAVDSNGFAACAYHISGTKSFGMTTNTTAMTINPTTGGTADLTTGCAGAGGGGSGT